MLQNGIEQNARTIIQEPQAIIVGPTCELVNQIHLDARKFTYNTFARAVVVYSGVNISHQARELRKGAHMVIGTPGRLMDFIRRRHVSFARCYKAQNGLICDDMLLTNCPLTILESPAFSSAIYNIHF